MKVFISWSGERSKLLAEAIREWLPNVLQFTKPYFTPADIEKGARWANEISKELEQSSIGVIAMTEENLTSPWIMFEAGALSKVVGEARVCPILFGIRLTDLVGPLTSFQAITFNRDEVRQLLTTINNAAKEAALGERSLDAAFDMWWRVLEKKIEDILSAAKPTSRPQRSPTELLEEVVENTRTIIRGLPSFPWQTTLAISNQPSMSPDVNAIIEALLQREKPAKGETENKRINCVAISPAPAGRWWVILEYDNRSAEVESTHNARNDAVKRAKELAAEHKVRWVER
jgi:hypothetical protein